MSKSSDADFDLELHFLPAWAQKAPEENRYAQFEGEGNREDRFGRDRRGRGQDQRRDRERDRGPRRQGPGPGPGPRGPRSGPPEGQAGPGQQPGQGSPRRFGNRDQRGDRDRGDRRRDLRDKPAPAPLPEINASIVADDKSVDLLARQIKMTGRAYPLFDIAHLILSKPERHEVTLTVKKDAEGKVIQSLFVCALDETPWLSEDEVVQHLLNRHFDLFYQAERTATEPPKGVYTFVAQCGMSGAILGPPNYHDYQNRLHKLHAERFSRMPFEVYKSRVKIVRDEAVVKKWIDDQSWKTEFVCLNLPEPLKLPNREEVEKHFRATHLPNVVKQVETLRMTGTASRNIPCHELRRLVRQVWEDQRRFPLQVAVVLSQQFATRGLQFFKVNKSVTHVAVARPHYLDLEAVPVSEGVRNVVDYVNAHPKCSRRQLVEALAPTPKAVPAEPAPVAPEQPAPAEATAPAEPPPATEGSPAAQEPPPAQPPARPAEPQPTPEQTTVISDLHWLIHQGHVIEFANGTLETAKKPIQRPPKPAPAPVQPTAAVEQTLAQSTVAAESGEPNVTAEAATVTLAPESGIPIAPEAPPVSTAVVEAGVSPLPEQTPPSQPAESATPQEPAAEKTAGERNPQQPN